jgi:hypothetical protein
MLLHSVYFCGRMGPTHAPIEIDVLIPRAAEATATLASLRSMLPNQRWRISAADSVGMLIESDVIGGALSVGPLTVNLASLQACGTQCVYRFGHRDAQAHLMDGLLVETGDDPIASRAEALYLLARFPGLRAEFIDYHGKTLVDSYEEIQRKITEGEHGGRRTRMEFLAVESPWVDRIRKWHERTTPAIEPLPVPARASLPDGDPWSVPDEEFREWMLDQALLRVPRTRPDPDLHAILAPQRGEQKPTHQGWETAHHAVMAALALDTAYLDPRDRRAVRIAMLLHDVGKIYNVWTPGSHPLIGAKQWRQFGPSWLSTAEAELITFLIANHDALGLMDRGVMSAEFRGAVTPLQLRTTLVASGRSLHEALRLNSAVYQADIGAVAALRWLLPLTPLLEGLVLAAAGEYGAVA